MVKTIGIKSGKYKVFTIPDFIKSKIGELSSPRKRFVNAADLEQSQVSKMCSVDDAGYCRYAIINNKCFLYRLTLKNDNRLLSRGNGIKSGRYQIVSVSDYIRDYGLSSFCSATGKNTQNVDHKMPRKDTDYIIINNKLFLYRFDIDLTKAKYQ